MSLFVHLALEKHARAIRRAGITRLRRWAGQQPGVFALPVVPNFLATHQWLRELKVHHHGPMVGVYFRIPDLEPVWVGHFRGLHRPMTAAQAEHFLRHADDSLGLEVIIERRIKPQEIRTVRRLPQVLGWRYYPASHGHKPCGCDWCSRGQYGARRIRAAWQRRRTTSSQTEARIEAGVRP